jgi:hypothetical protein
MAGVRDRVRFLTDRPTNQGQRRRAFAVAAAVIFTVAAVVALALPGGHTRKQPVVRPAAPRPAVSAPLPRPAPTLTPAHVAAAKTAARAFLRGYLAYTYGHRWPLEAAAPTLKRAVASRPVPRVPPRMQHAHPRIVALTTESATARRVPVTATITDGVTSYAVQVIAEPSLTPGGWWVAAVTQ